ncbi:MAG TPA: hypothetical protein VLG38_06985 [Gammaproteobacteria bacterium]|nr:hypothetical protein [Gammaproteobacteria bacterium]
MSSNEGPKQPQQIPPNVKSMLEAINIIEKSGILNVYYKLMHYFETKEVKIELEALQDNVAVTNLSNPSALYNPTNVQDITRQIVKAGDAILFKSKDQFSSLDSILFGTLESTKKEFTPHKMLLSGAVFSLVSPMAFTTALAADFARNGTVDVRPAIMAAIASKLYYELSNRVAAENIASLAAFTFFIALTAYAAGKERLAAGTKSKLN